MKLGFQGFPPFAFFSADCASQSNGRVYKGRANAGKCPLVDVWTVKNLAWPARSGDCVVRDQTHPRVAEPTVIGGRADEPIS